MNEGESSQVSLNLPNIKEKGESFIKQTTTVKVIQVSIEGLIHINQFKDFIIKDIEDNLSLYLIFLSYM